MKYSLKNEYKKLLNEEIASIKSKSTDYEEELYDIKFSSDGTISNGSKVSISDEYKDRISLCSLFTSEPSNKIMDFIKRIEKISSKTGKKHGITVRMYVGNMSLEDIVSRLNKYYTETIFWQPINRIGRGEIATNIAFYTLTKGVPGYSSSHKEPDFVAARYPGNFTDVARYSIKSFTKANILKTKDTSTASGAQTGTNLSENVIETLNKMSNEVFDKIPYTTVFSVSFEPAKEIGSKTFTSSCFRNVVKYFIDKLPNKEAKERKLTRLKELVLDLRDDIVIEHNAEGIIGINNANKFFAIHPKEGKSKIGIRAFSGSRIQFEHLESSNPTTFLSVIEKEIENLNNEDFIETENIDTSLELNSYIPQGKVLKEVYPNLFKKKIISEGGKAAHMMHPYENLHLKISEMKEMISDFQEPFEISEKVDGVNYNHNNRKNKKDLLSVFNHLYSINLNEGIFHMIHPYEYHSSNEFKLGGLLKIINEIEKGILEASEKLDGQNLWFGFRDGNPVFAYNMKELQSGGVNWERLSEPYEIQDKKDIPKDFSGLEKIIRPHIRKEDKLIPSHGGHASFKDGVEVIHHCLVDAYSRDPQLIDFIFENGKNFSSSEVIHAEGPNQILYGENFIAPHFVMDKSGNQFPDKYKELFSLLKFEQNKVKNPKGFKLLTRAQRDAVALQIMEFEDEKEKLLFVNDLRDEYEKRIQSLINKTSLTFESTIKDFHRYHLVNYINSKGEQGLSSNKSFVDSLLLFIHGSTLKASGLSNTPDYKNILKRLDLGNAKSRSDFKSSYIGDIVEMFFDFGIDINRGIKTTATSRESQDINHQRIIETNLNNIKKAFIIAKEIELEVNRLTQLGEEENPEHKKLFSLARKLKFQIIKVKRVIKRVKQRKGFASNKDALTFIVSSSIEGLVLKRKIPDSDNVMELKLTGFFAPLNQVLNAIRFEVGHIDLLDQFLESDGQIFSLNNQNIPTTYDIESLLEKKLFNKKVLNQANFSLLEMYNLKTYSETQQNEFDISVVPMSAKPFTIGHEDLVKTACEKSKEVYVVISATSRMRKYENPVTGDSMEKLYFEDNPSGFVPDLESLLNRNIPECQGKVKVVYSKNPVTDVTTIFEEDFAYENLEKDKKYCIFVGDIDDAEVYSPDMLSHMEDSLNVVYRDSDEERLSSGTRTRASLNTGRFTDEREIPIKSKPGKTKIDKVVILSDPYLEGSDMYNQSFEEFARNLSNIYNTTQKKRIYDYISGESRNAIDNVLSKIKDISSNKEAKETLSKEEVKVMASLGGFRKAKQMSLDMFS